MYPDKKEVLNHSEIKAEIVAVCSKNKMTFEEAEKLLQELSGELQNRAMKTQM